jgi:hypothetical protein
VNAGADLSVKLGTGTQLSGTVTDDGLPQGNTLVKTWSKATGPGTATFSNASSTSASVSFSATGTYVLMLTASDGSLSTSDNVTAVVTSNTTSTTFSSSINRRNPSRSFDLNTGSGKLSANLSFSSKKQNSANLTINLLDARGTVLASVQGSSPLLLERDLIAGSYTLQVSGDSVSFELLVQYPMP